MHNKYGIIYQMSIASREIQVIDLGKLQAEKEVGKITISFTLWPLNWTLKYLDMRRNEWDMQGTHL